MLGPEWATFQGKNKLKRESIKKKLHFAQVSEYILVFFSRLLSFGHGLKVTSVDGQANFVDTAGKFDNQLERSANKKQQVFPEKSGPDQVKD